MQETSRKCQYFTDSVIRRMTRISLDCGAINLAQGFPDFDPPKEMMDRLAEVSHQGPHQYPITMALEVSCKSNVGNALLIRWKNML